MTVHKFVSSTADAHERGEQLGSFGAEHIAENLRYYSELFGAVGVTQDDMREHGSTAMLRIAEWAPRIAEELRGVAAGSGQPEWVIGLINARTEILATVGAVGEGECSTVVSMASGAAPATVQTWDWHDITNDHVLVAQHPGGLAGEVRYFTEFGIAGKIGVNEAGLGLHFNILNHRDDGDGVGVPVHVVARRILDDATSLDEAIAIARSARVSASTVLTVVVDRDGVAEGTCIELSPSGSAVVEPRADWLFHTNHFLDPRLAEGELVPATSSSYPRLAVLQERRADFAAAADPAARARAMAIHDADGAPVCCHVDPALSFEHRWETRLVISLDLQAGRLQYFDGLACEATAEGFEVFPAGA